MQPLTAWRILLLVGLCVPSLVLAEDAPAPPPKAIQPAMQKYDEAVKEAEQAYRKALLAAKTALLKEVEMKLQVVMREGNLEATKALAGMQTQLKSDIESLNFNPVIVRVSAKSFLKVMEVKKEQVFHFEARGTWSMGVRDPNLTCDANGIADHVGALMGRLNGKLILIGKDATIQMPESGALELGPNDTKGMEDNGGTVEVRIESVVRP